jgi:hypothetical protein
MNVTQQTVSAQVVALPSLPIAALWALWDKHFPRRPENPNRRFMESRIAYKIQEEAFGGLSSDTQRKLIDIGMRHSRIKGRQKHADIHLAPGTVLVREWGERDHKTRSPHEYFPAYCHHQGTQTQCGVLPGVVR